MSETTSFILKKSFCPSLLLPERPKAGNRIIVKGKIVSPDSRVRWAVNLVKGNFLNIPIHVVFQLLDDHQTQGMWFCSSRIDGAWSQVKASSEGFPLVNGKPFELKILLEQTTFSVELDGEPYFSDIPLSPFVVDDITGIILAGQWGQVQITEVGYYIPSQPDPAFTSPINDEYKISQQQTAMIPYSPNDEKYPNSYLVDENTLQRSVFEDDIILQPITSGFLSPDYEPFRPFHQNIPQLQPDPQLTTDPHLLPQFNIQNFIKINN